VNDIANVSLWKPTLVAITVAVIVGLIGGLATDIGPWYRDLKKPWFQPPDWAFGPAWTLIYAATGTAAVMAWRAAAEDSQRTLILVAFLINALLNVAWSVIFFTFKRPDLALIEVSVLWLSIVALIYIVWPHSKTAAYLLLIYLAWVTFASALNLATVKLNPHIY
jgi:tryptophan-rich sensory protein